MTVMEIAHAFTALCAEGRMAEAQRFWSDDVTSIEAFPGPHQVAHGRAAVLDKQRAWMETMTVHSTQCQGPYVNGDQFAITFQMDCTGPDGVRMAMREVALYKVADKAIVEERFLPFVGG